MNRERSFGYRVKNTALAAVIGAASTLGGFPERAAAYPSSSPAEYTAQSARQAEKRNIRVIFIHGWQGGGVNPDERDGSFLDPLRDYTQDNGIEAVYPDFPGGVTPHARVWKEKLRDEVQAAADEDRNVVLLGFSLGTRTTLLFIEACLNGEEGYDPKLLEHVSAMILVAPFNNNPANANRRRGAYADFFENGVNTEAAAEAIPIKRVVHSKDDKAVPFEQGRQLAGELKLQEGEFIDLEDSDHFNARESGALIIEVLDGVLREYSESN